MLVAFSHLRWDFVWQRPQHLLSRFAQQMPVVVVEEPEWGYQDADMRMRHDRGVTIVTPLIAGSPPAPGFGAHINAEISRILSQVVSAGSDLICWYYTPMALGAEPEGSCPVLRIYDAMDELASFLGAPPELRDNERRLLAQVDLVFTGGPTLYRARRDKHPAVYCFPSGVEGAHFAPKFSAFVPPEDLTTRPRPILGYYGVIDERLNLPLLAAIADARPDWTIALVGPVAKIDARSIPVRTNIMRFGQQPYRDLPAFLGAFDIALMPFAHNDATRAISPTKTLEYLAGEKPVISTPITDVIDLFGDVVEIAATAPEFVAAAELLLSRTGAEARRWHARAAHLVAVNDWDAIGAAMLDVMGQARAAKSLPLVDQGAVALTA